MILTRMAFLRLFGMAAVGLRLEPAIAVSAFRAEDALPAHFHPLVGDAFRVSADSSSVTLRLAKVRERPLTKNVAQFSLTFHGPADVPLADRIYSLRHPALGSFSAFVSAISIPNEERRVYQACFSRFVRIYHHV